MIGIKGKNRDSLLLMGYGMWPLAYEDILTLIFSYDVHYWTFCVWLLPWPCHWLPVLLPLAWRPEQVNMNSKNRHSTQP